MNPLRNLFDFGSEETAGDVVFFRVFEAFVVGAAAHLVWAWGVYIPRIDAIMHPEGLARYVDVSFMLGPVLPLVNAGIVSALLLLGFFRATRFAYPAAFLLLHLQYVARFSLGKVEHGSNMVGMTLLGLALAVLFFDAPRFRRRFTLGFTYFFVGLGYFLAGCSKLVGTGLAWADGRHLWMWIHEKGVDAFAQTGALSFNALQTLALSDYWLATAFLAVGMLTELFAFLFWWRRFRLPAGLAILGLHVGIYATMGILFYYAMIELTLLTFPWAAWIDRAAARTGLRLPRGRWLLRPDASSP